MALPKFPVKTTRKGTKKFTVQKLKEDGYSDEQAERLAGMDTDNELPKKRPAQKGTASQGK